MAMPVPDGREAVVGRNPRVFVVASDWLAALRANALRTNDESRGELNRLLAGRAAFNCVHH